MMNSIFTKTLYDKRYFILGWTLGMFLLAVLMGSFFPAMRQDQVLDSLLTQMPDALKGLIGDVESLRTYSGYIASQLFDIRVPLIAGVMAIILALGLSTREEEDGELRTMLSLPISRDRLLIEKWLAICLIMAISMIGLIAGIYIVLPFIDPASIGLDQVLSLIVMTCLVMIAYASVTFAAGMASGRRSIASLVGIVVIVGGFLLSTFAKAVEWLQPFERLSLLHYFPAVSIAKQGIATSDAVVLIGVSVVSLGIAFIFFRRRDIA